MRRVGAPKCSPWNIHPPFSRSLLWRQGWLKELQNLMLPRCEQASLLISDQLPARSALISHNIYLVLSNPVIGHHMSNNPSDAIINKTLEAPPGSTLCGRDTKWGDFSLPSNLAANRSTRTSLSSDPKAERLTVSLASIVKASNSSLFFCVHVSYS